ncbi:SDR family NAD(P)-dependent oxidoreductase [Synechococcus sp. CS-603]|uniref:SDR family NAD(P)-dependent oxidoreductase n=1 Tax=Synechococcus sp. CS-603 TaxID=2847981 RepID=UPI00223C2E32|nr:SDR family NAD(P)-dependent oxidoreductase [Synechococcus sp. CS-603]MCT0202288.1 SDR family NAD(P)-dependent oxidoreductase [Synechococcus sp. CS-603]
MASALNPSADGAHGLRHWQGDALVVGCGGIGRALMAELGRRAPGLTLWAASRQGWCPGPEDPATGIRSVALDLTDDSSLERFALALEPLRSSLRLVINTAGLLHQSGLQPEKRLRQVNRQALEQLFAVNAYGPLLLAQAVEPLLSRSEPVLFASLSARVGSIGDNQLGGWYGYRAAKAAQNQFLRCLALEWKRRLPLACVSLLHPGTTETPLTAPFRASVPAERLFSPERAASQLLDVLEVQGPEQSGRFLAWNGAEIPW